MPTASRAYAYALEECGVEPMDAMLVAVHPRDIDGARRAGLATAWIDGKTLYLPFTQVALPALLPTDPDLGHQLEELHGTIGEIFYWVIGLHILAALYHHFVRRDDALRRML